MKILFRFVGWEIEIERSFCMSLVVLLETETEAERLRLKLEAGGNASHGVSMMGKGLQICSASSLHVVDMIGLEESIRNVDGFAFCLVALQSLASESGFAKASLSECG